MARNTTERWPREAYRVYRDCLENGLPSCGIHVIPNMPVPSAIDAMPAGRRRLLRATDVARWAFRHRRLGESYAAIARSEERSPASPEDAARRLAQFLKAERVGDEDVRRYERAKNALRLAEQRADPDAEPISADSVRHAVDRDEAIWEIAELGPATLEFTSPFGP